MLLLLQYWSTIRSWYSFLPWGIRPVDSGGVTVDYVSFQLTDSRFLAIFLLYTLQDINPVLHCGLLSASVWLLPTLQS